jgi:hypothetical protein
MLPRTMVVLLVAIFGVCAAAETLEEFEKNQKKEMNSQSKEFDTFQKQEAKDFKNFQEERSRAMAEWTAEYNQFEKSGLRRITVTDPGSGGAVSMHDVDYGTERVNVKSVAAGQTKNEAVLNAVRAAKKEFQEVFSSGDPSIKAEGKPDKVAALSKISEKDVAVQKTDSGYTAKVQVSKPFKEIMPAVMTAPTPAPAKPKTTNYTSIIIDARGMGCKACLVPSVVDSNGKQLYGPRLVEKEAAINGMAVWVSTPEAARGSAKAGKNPFLIKADSIKDQRQFVVSGATAEAIDAMAGSPVIRLCKVIFIVD